LYKNFGKRIFDIILSIIALFILLLPGLVISFLIAVTSSGPVFFMQQRLGYKEKVFLIYKFRTMIHKQRESTEQIFHEHPEVTAIGRILRRFKLDEIPQLINIIKGEMSFIGPRPCLPELQKKFDDNGKIRTQTRPGLFGLADINGGYYLPWPERWVHDRYYVENINLLLDLKLFVKVIPIILFDEDFYLKRIKRT